MLSKLALFIGSSLGDATAPIPIQHYTQRTRTLAELSEALSRQHNERRTGLGVTNGNAVMQLYTSPKGSWTLVLTLPGGPSCIAGAGENWQRLKPIQQKPRGTGS